MRASCRASRRGLDSGVSARSAHCGATTVPDRLAHSVCAALPQASLHDYQEALEDAKKVRGSAGGHSCVLPRWLLLTLNSQLLHYALSGMDQHWGLDSAAAHPAHHVALVLRSTVVLHMCSGASGSNRGPCCLGCAAVHAASRHHLLAQLIMNHSSTLWLCCTVCGAEAGLGQGLQPPGCCTRWVESAG